MPQVKKEKKSERKTITIPKPMIQEVDRIIAQLPMYGNRQQFVESAIREKIEKVKLIETKPPSDVE